jgi:hypothetical protein
MGTGPGLGPGPGPGPSLGQKYKNHLAYHFFVKTKEKNNDAYIPGVVPRIV